MKAYLVITIDVEPDCTTTWQYSDPLTFKGVSIGIKERLQPLFIKHDIIPTYLINNVVLEDVESITIFSRLEGQYELGSHLHPEFMEPQKSSTSYAGKRGLANSSEYTPDIEFEKIKNITKLFTDNFNYKPTSFRAGRFSAGPNTIACLDKLGYKVDTSVTPHVIWNDKTRKNPVDYRNAREQPYFIKRDTILEEDVKGNILQVPVSIVNKPAALWGELRRTFFGIRSPLKKTKSVWLRPVYSSNADLRNVVEDTLHRYRDEKVVVLNMMFHNVEVMPGLSPYTKTESDCEVYLNQLISFFQYCKTKNIKCVALTDLYEIQKGK
jgi:hypothetical protein